MEFLLWSGELASTHLFDLAERCIPAAYLNDALTDDACPTQLLERAGNASGVATANDLGDYLRIPTATAARLLPTPGSHPYG